MGAYFNVNSGNPPSLYDGRIVTDEGRQSRLTLPVRITINPKPIVDVISQPFKMIRTASQLQQEIGNSSSIVGSLIYDNTVGYLRKPWINRTNDVTLRTYKFWYTDAWLLWNPLDRHFEPGQRRKIGEYYMYVFPDLEEGINIKDIYTLRHYVRNNGFQLVVSMIPGNSNYYHQNNYSVEIDGAPYHWKIDSGEFLCPRIVMKMSAQMRIKRTEAQQEPPPYKDMFLYTYSLISDKFESDTMPFAPASNTAKDYIEAFPDFDTRRYHQNIGDIFTLGCIFETVGSWEDFSYGYVITNKSFFSLPHRNSLLSSPPIDIWRDGDPYIPIPATNYNFTSINNLNRGFVFSWGRPNYQGGKNESDYILLLFDNIAFYFNNKEVKIYIKSINSVKFRYWKTVKLPGIGQDFFGMYGIIFDYLGKGVISIRGWDVTASNLEKPDVDKTRSASKSIEGAPDLPINTNNIMSSDITSGEALQLPTDGSIPILSAPNGELDLAVFTGKMQVITTLPVETFFNMERLVCSQYASILPMVTYVPTAKVFPLASEIGLNQIAFYYVPDNPVFHTEFETKLLDYNNTQANTLHTTANYPMEVYEIATAFHPLTQFTAMYEHFAHSFARNLYIERIDIDWPGVYNYITPRHFQKQIPPQFVKECDITYGVSGTDKCKIVLHNIDRQLQWLYDLNEFVVQVEVAKDENEWRKVFYGQTNLNISSGFISSKSSRARRSPIDNEQFSYYEEIELNVNGIDYERLNAISPIWRYDASGQYHTDVVKSIYGKAGFVTPDLSFEPPGFPPNNPIPGIEDQLPIGSTINTYEWAIEPPTSYWQLVHKIVNQFSGWILQIDHENQKILYTRRPNTIDTAYVQNDRVVKFFVNSEDRHILRDLYPTAELVKAYTDYSVSKVKPICDVLVAIGGFGEGSIPPIIVRTADFVTDPTSRGFVAGNRIVCMIFKHATNYDGLKSVADIVAPRMLLPKTYVTFESEIPNRNILYHDWIWHQQFGLCCVKSFSVSFTNGRATLVVMLPQLILDNGNIYKVFMFEEN